MSAAIGAALAGARTMTATSSQGLALMAEVVYIAASMRAPIVMAVGNRALSGPINIHCDHSDSMLIRDSGVIQLFAENAQEAYDLTVHRAAPRRASRRAAAGARLPGRLHDHALRRAGELLADEDVRALRRRVRDSAPVARHRRTRRRRGRSRCPTTTSSCAGSRSPRSSARARRAAPSSRPSSSALTGRRYGALEPYRLDGRRPRDRRARLDRRHHQGRRRRAARRGRARRPAEDRSFRPFPARRVARAARGGRRRSSCSTAPTRPAARRRSSPRSRRRCTAAAASSRGHVYGLGGRDLHPEDMREVFAGAALAYVGLRGEPCPA